MGASAKTVIKKVVKRRTPPPLPAAAAPAAEWVAPASLKAWAKNPRKNDGEPVAKVAESIKRFGFAAPIVARKATREIIAGHTRWKAATQLKLDRVPVRFLDITEREARLLALADNRLGELADWDVPELREALAGYDVDDALVAGWDEGDIAKLAPDEADDLEADASVKKDDNHCPNCGRYMSDKMKAALRKT